MDSVGSFQIVMCSKFGRGSENVYIDRNQKNFSAGEKFVVAFCQICVAFTDRTHKSFKQREFASEYLTNSLTECRPNGL